MEMMISYKNGRKNTYIRQGNYIFMSNIKSSSKNIDKRYEENDFDKYEDINLMVNMINKRI